MNRGYEELYAAIWKQAIKDSTKDIRKRVEKELKEIYGYTEEIFKIYKTEMDKNPESLLLEEITREYYKEVVKKYSIKNEVNEMIREEMHHYPIRKAIRRKKEKDIAVKLLNKIMQNENLIKKGLPFAK